jgi:uncharacterized protein DUF5681
MDERVERDLTNKVGYAKPPKHTRFTKGRSGNPKGRPTGSKNLATMMIEELTQTVAIVENGKRTKVPKIRAFDKRFNRAMVGDFKALQQIVIMLRSHDRTIRKTTQASRSTNSPNFISGQFRRTWRIESTHGRTHPSFNYIRSKESRGVATRAAVRISPPRTCSHCAMIPCSVKTNPCSIAR